MSVANNPVTYASFNYTLNPVGNRASVVEEIRVPQSRRAGVVAHAELQYDALYRLTNETVNATAGTSYELDYTYASAVGSRAEPRFPFPRRNTPCHRLPV